MSVWVLNECGQMLLRSPLKSSVFYSGETSEKQELWSSFHVGGTVETVESRCGIVECVCVRSVRGVRGVGSEPQTQESVAVLWNGLEINQLIQLKRLTVALRWKRSINYELFFFYSIQKHMKKPSEHCSTWNESWRDSSWSFHLLTVVCLKLCRTRIWIDWFTRIRTDE